MPAISEFSTNIAGKVRNTKLPKAKALWPLFEVISNSIHAIEEKNTKGKIDIEVIRRGRSETLLEIDDVEIYPVTSFNVKDNGVGFNEANFESFLTAESEYKIQKGAKGVGRFVCLKAFNHIHFDSFYRNTEGKIYRRTFDLKPKEKGIFDYEHNESDYSSTGTQVTLKEFNADYIDYCPKQTKEIAEKIIEHFLVYFLLDKCPLITLVDSNKKTIILQDVYNSNFKKHLTTLPFQIGKENFDLFLLQWFEVSKGHRIHYCGNEREVVEENINKLIPDLGKSIHDNNGERYTYQAYVTGEYLDKHVLTERTGFDFPEKLEDNDEDQELIFSSETISLRDIRDAVIDQLEIELFDYLSKVREDKLNSYRNHIYEDAPQFKPILKYRPEAIKKMTPGLSGNKLNIELFKIQSELELEIKELGDKVLHSDKDIRSSEEYKQKYDEFIEKFNDLGKANLAKYVVHRKAVINLLDEFIGLDEDESFQTEDTIHKIFFPLKSVSDEVQYEQQNLWLIDERLAYHYYLGSDKPLKDTSVVEIPESKDRPDLLLFNSSFSFVDDDAPHNSFVIVEFKRPERTSYSTSDEKKNPIDQVVSYIRQIRENKAKDRRGKMIHVDKERTPFYVYIICDLNAKLLEIISERDYKKTPDGLGYFYFHKEYNAYIELITYQKLLKDARNRNRILFDKLGLPY